MKVELLRELLNVKDKLLQAQKEKADEVVRAKDEVLQAQKEKADEVVRAKDEVLQAQKEKAAAELHVTQLRADLRAAADAAARAVEGVKLRGVVEYVAKVHGRASGAQQGLDALFREDAQLQRIVATFGTEFKLLEADLERCACGLYHTLSKELHGSQALVEVREADWRSPAERAVLCAVLERFAVTYAYVDVAGATVQSPYAEPAKRVLEG